MYGVHVPTAEATVEENPDPVVRSCVGKISAPWRYTTKKVRVMQNLK
jgi:hypothetical protein